MSYVDEIIAAFQALGGSAYYSELYEYIERHTSRNLPPSWEAIIRARIEERSSDSSAYLGEDDLFFSVNGIGNGYWGLRSSLDPEPIAPDIEVPDLPRRGRVESFRVIRDTTITRELKLIYKNKCQICGKTVILYNRNYSEAHHIKPLGNPHNGADTVENILILCPNHHVEFDYGAIAIDPITMSLIHFDKNNEIHGRPLFLKPGHVINKACLKYHLENIFKRANNDPA